jgi:hypothetical protein
LNTEISETKDKYAKLNKNLQLENINLRSLNNSLKIKNEMLELATRDKLE